MKLNQMFKEKVTIKLALYSLSILSIFSIMVVGIFISVFKSYVGNNEWIIKDQKNYLLKSARLIGNYINITERGEVYLGGLELINSGEELANALSRMHRINIFSRGDVNFLILNRNKELLISDSESREYFNYYEGFSYNEREKIDSVFEGNEIYFDNFSYFTKRISMIVGVPIYSHRGKITGVLLIEDVLNSTKRIVLNGSYLMIFSLIIAFVFSFILFMIFSYKFTKPLYKMRDHAFKLTKGDYDAKNNIVQNDEIGYLANTLDLLSEKLKEADEQKKRLEKMRSDFISNISHELRTPVTVMLGSLEALVDGIVQDKELVQEYYSNMLSEAKFLSRLVGDLLEINRLQNSDFIIEKSQLFLLDVINDVVRSLRKISYKRNISINVYNNNFKDTIIGDYGRLKQMFTIVLDNAIKFSNDNSEVKIILDPNCIKIVDLGTGIKPEDIPYIFDRFYKERSEKNKIGTGLGLSIAKNIAIRHDIDLSVKSVYGEYTEFLFIY